MKSTNDTDAPDIDSPKTAGDTPQEMATGTAVNDTAVNDTASDAPELVADTVPDTVPDTTAKAAEPPGPAPPMPPMPPMPPSPPSAQQRSSAEPLLAPLSESSEPAGKSPVLAVFLAMALLGHFYIGRYQRAVVIICSFFLSIYLLPLRYCIVTAIFIWFFNLFDAYRQTELENLMPADSTTLAGERNRASFLFGSFMVGLGIILLIEQLFPRLLSFAWIDKWWPVILVGIGIYVMYGAFKERRGETTEETSLPLGFS